MSGYHITMRIWTCMGKENVFSVDYYLIRNDKLIIADDREQHINHVVEKGCPCCISFLSNNEFDYRVEEFQGCSLGDSGSIIYETHTVTHAQH